MRFIACISDHCNLVNAWTSRDQIRINETENIEN